MQPASVIETERLLLRPWSLDDVPAFHAIVSDPDVMRYIGPGTVWTRQQTQDFVERQIAMYQRRGFCLWALQRHRSDDAEEPEALGGYCGVADLGSDEIEIGWRLAKPLWGGGLATEAAQAVVHHAFTKLNIPRLVAVAQLPNRASMRVMEKIGMRYLEERTRTGNPVACYVIERDGQ